MQRAKASLATREQTSSVELNVFLYKGACSCSGHIQVWLFQTKDFFVLTKILSDEIVRKFIF